MATAALWEMVLRGPHAVNAFLALNGLSAPLLPSGLASGALSTAGSPAAVSLMHDVLSVLKGARNGAVYGAKIRFPHALVMTYLFTSGLTHKQKWERILRATQQHSRNLMKFVFIYKSLMVLIRRARSSKVPVERSYDSFLAGTVGGAIVFGENNNINNQIVLYLFSRILVGLAKTSLKRVNEARGAVSATSAVAPIVAPDATFTVFAAVVWGVVMWLFRHERDTLQGSLQASMHYLYNNAHVFSTLGDFMWHNVAPQ
jgi:peroxisomal membrane protein 4